MKILITALVSIGIFALVVVIIANCKKVSYEEATSLIKEGLYNLSCVIWKHAKAHFISESAPQFVPNEETIQRVIQGVANHSQLSSDDTLWELNLLGSFPVLSVQILPQNDHSVVYAEETAKTIVGNVAKVNGIPINIASECVPGTYGTHIIHIGIASTISHKRALAEYLEKKNRQAIFDAGGDKDNFNDNDLDADIADFERKDEDHHDI